MNVRNYAALSDHDFELFIADLLGADEGKDFEVSSRGADGGIDLHHDSGCELDIVQCKHMLDISASQLRTTAKKKAENFAKMPRKPDTCKFVTS